MCSISTHGFAQYPYPDTTQHPVDPSLFSIKSNEIASTIWSLVRIANPSFALVNEGGLYQPGYTSQWSFMVGKTGKVKFFGEYSFLPDRFIRHLFHVGVLYDIVTFEEQGLIFDSRYGFTPGIGFFADFKDYGLSAEYAVWYEVMQYTRVFVRYRFNFWISQPGIGFQDFALGLALPL